MSSIEITEVETADRAGPPIRAFALDTPTGGEVSDSDGFVLSGWILGAADPIPSVAVSESGRTLTVMSVGERRDDVAGAYPDAISAAGSGFRGWVPTVALGPSFSLDLHANAADGAQIPLGTIRGRRWRSAERSPDLADGVTPVGQRRLPSFFIIGTQRGGTRSLYEYLAAHPRVQPAETAEVHFFSLYFDRGLSWYQSQFPETPADQMTGEASPYYLFHPLAARRMHAVVPEAKLIVLLRDPVERAFSHYQFEVQQGNEPLTFEDAIAVEEDRLGGEEERLLADDTYVSFAHQHYSYLARGRYVDQLRRWLDLFPREQLLILKSEAFLHDPAAMYRRTTDFLGLPPAPLSDTHAYNETPDAEMQPETRRRLRAYYAQHNADLPQLAGAELTWGEPGLEP